MAPKAVRAASKPRSAKRSAKRATRRAARKARRASKPKAPKAAVKATKPRKPKKVTKKMQTGSMRRVWNGSKLYTKSGLTKKDLCLSKSGRVMTKKQFKNGQKMKKSGWMQAVAKARKELGITGFVLMNRGAEGKALYEAAKSYYN